MKKNNHHILHQVNLEINTSDEMTAFQIRKRIDSFLNEDLFPKVERLFDQMASPEEIQRFESIQMEFELKHADDIDLLAEQFVTQIKEKIEFADSEISDFQGDGNNVEHSNLLKNNQQQRQPAETALADAPLRRESITYESNLKNTFIYFIETGQLPWFAIPEILNEFLLPVHFNKALNDKRFIGQLKELFRIKPEVLQRFVLQFKPEPVEALLILLTSETGIPHKKLISLITAQKPTIRTALYQLIISKLIDQQYQIAPDIVQHIQSGQQMNQQLKEIFGTTNFDSINQSENEQSNYNKPEIRQQKEKCNNQIYIRNAGLILAHPFFRELFKRAGCVSGNEFISAEKQLYAVHLLHYLSSGNEQQMEYNLTFEKYLCGMSPVVPIDRNIELLEHDKQECDDLLNSIISNWVALKNTSSEELRQNFFLRNGKLDLQKSSPKLYIERKSFDLLLEQLPWNISMVKLPWMNDLLLVEW
jgi:hypothetical protein